MREVQINHLRLLLLLTQLATIFLFPSWMYFDVWSIVNNVYKVNGKIVFLNDRNSKN